MYCTHRGAALVVVGCPSYPWFSSCHQRSNGLTSSSLDCFGYRPGPPKQFASFCGICFSLPAAALYFAGDHDDDDDGETIAGAVFLGMLMGAAALEGFANFCLGCLFFGWGIRFGIFPSAVYRIYANTRQNVIYQYVVALALWLPVIVLLFCSCFRSCTLACFLIRSAFRCGESLV